MQSEIFKQEIAKGSSNDATNSVIQTFNDSTGEAFVDKIQDRAQAERFLRAWVYDAQASGLFQLVKFTQLSITHIF